MTKYLKKKKQNVVCVAHFRAKPNFYQNSVPITYPILVFNILFENI